MSSLSIIIGILIGFNGALGIWMVQGYNKLMRYRNMLEEAMNALKLQYQRKKDLAHELGNTASRLLPQDAPSLIQLEQIYPDSQSAEQLPAHAGGDKEIIQNVLNSLLEQHFSSREFLAWQMRASDLDAQFQNSKRTYNSILREYNSMVESFPGNLLARAIGIRKGEFVD